MSAIIPTNLTKELPRQHPALQEISPARPTVDALYHQIPLACSWNVAEFMKEGVRHEENAYGYLNSLFTSIFLPSQRFQVNPQYPLRPRAHVHEKNISVGSTGEIHSGRGNTREVGMQYPDFVISKPSPRGANESQSRINAIIAIIEVKKSDGIEGNSTITPSNFAATVTQTIAYAERVKNHTYSVPEVESPIVASYIIYGEYYTKLVSASNDKPNVFVAAPLQYVWERLDLDQGRAPLTYRLCELAVKHWNMEVDY